MARPRPRRSSHNRFRLFLALDAAGAAFAAPPLPATCSDFARFMAGEAGPSAPPAGVVCCLALSAALPPLPAAEGRGRRAGGAGRGSEWPCWRVGVEAEGPARRAGEGAAALRPFLPGSLPHQLPPSASAQGLRHVRQA